LSSKYVWNEVVKNEANIWRREKSIAMYSLIQTRKTIAILIIVTFSAFSINSAPARAAMVDTGEIFKQNQHDLSRKRINMFLDRSEVYKHLVDWGINPDEAKARIDSLADEEIENIASRMDQLPAGGDAVGVIIGAALFVFIVLLITDILGFTNVFSFVKSR
jgi:Family of unknown function (DUF6627)